MKPIHYAIAHLLLASSAQFVLASDQPNLVVILADDCTFRDIGCYGGQALTPHIDALAKEGLRFERCFQAAPMCSPTRHNLYTGIYPVKSGAYPNHTLLYPDVKTIAHYLKPLGYRVAQSGKLHVGPRKNFPWDRLGKGWGDPKVKAIKNFFVEQAQTGQPFCLFLCFNSPHDPWDQGVAADYNPDSIELPPYIVDTPVVRKVFCDYLAEITYFDKQVGSVLEILEDQGLRENTLVMVLSEQGNIFPFAKWTCYDHGLQSAMVIRWPGLVAAGTTTRAMVEYVDITPTLVDVAGGDPIPGLDGKSFLSVLQGKSDHHKEHVFGVMTTRGIKHGSEEYGIRSIRSERYKLIINLNHESAFKNAAMRKPFYKSMVDKANKGNDTAQWLIDSFSHRPEIELYDLQLDPLERTNIAGQVEQADRVAALTLRLREWMASQGDLGVPTERTAHLRQIKNIDENRRFDPMEFLRARSEMEPYE